ncbi:MAG: ABC transporter permease [Planctomycetota bacterium]
MIRRGFAQHKLALFSLNVLVVFYLVAIFAEFIAVAPSSQSRVDAAYMPPMAVGWSVSEGLHTSLRVQEIDPVTLRKQYLIDDERVLPLRLLPAVEPYKLMGLIPMRTRLIGVDRDAADVLGLAEEAGVVDVWYPLGSDRFGRCIFSRIVIGARVSLSIGLIGVACTFVIGMVVGGISGYVGGRTDTAIQRVIEIINALPQLPLWLALAAVFPPDWSSLTVYFAITVALSLLNWTGLARVVRGKILSLREEDYAVAARLLGASHGRVLFRHLIPGFISHILVALTLSIPMMILGETTLSFLGLGLRPPVVSWGVMLQDCLDVKAVRFYPWLLLPVVFIVVTVMSFNFVGDGMRDAADPYSSR